MAKRFGAAGFLLLPIIVCTARAEDDPKTYPAHVLIIRHAEKPPASAMSFDLNAEGKERADALPKLFMKADDRSDPFPTPDFLFASTNSAKSHRPNETLAPLAKKLGLKVNDDVASDDFPKLTQLLHDARYAGKTVLICWQHSKLPDLAEKLHAVGAPDLWDADVFDRVWQIDYDKDGKATFTNRPQHLMPKDAEK